LQHRSERVPLWTENGEGQDGKISRQDVVKSVRNIQLALLRLQDCKQLAKDYEWDKLADTLNEQIFHTDLYRSCYVLKRADNFLTPESRDVVGFDWGSCAWRHCGALADAQEAIDELEHLLGVLEPFECLFCIDIVERSLRDIFDVTTEYHDTTLQIPAYQPLQRMSDVNEESSMDGFDTEFMETLVFLRNSAS